MAQGIATRSSRGHRGHLQTLDGQKVYIATTVAAGCVLGAEPATTAGTDDLKDAYSVFGQGARDIAPKYAPETVNTDVWKGTKAAWKILLEHVVILRRFLHAWLKILDRAGELDLFAEISRRVWEAYHAPDRRGFGQRIRSLRTWAREHLSGVVLEKVLDLCKKRDRWSIAYGHPKGYRTSNMLDRLMRGMNRSFDHGQHLHGSHEACWRLPRLLAAKPVDVGVARRIPMSIPPKSVTVRITATPARVPGTRWKRGA
jgi:hypothetical protein